ncbi:MAG: trehalose-6-phosphate synthase [Rhodocyclaceae bacterium]|nr:MAG: trehalose-6-phosphate synthase [Rhodocyclaceae bacterium]
MPRMRLSLRFLLPISVLFALLATLMMPLVDAWNLRWSIRDLDNQSQLITETLKEPLVELIVKEDYAKVQAMLNSAIKEKRLYALAYCDEAGKMRRWTQTFPTELGCAPSNGENGVVRINSDDSRGGPVHLSIQPLKDEGQVFGYLVFVHDMGYLEHRSSETRGYVIAAFTILAVLVMMITLLVAHLSWHNWMAGIRAVLRGENPIRAMEQADPEVRPIIRDLNQMLSDASRRSTLRDDATTQWGPETLRQLLHDHLYGDEILVVSNREPYVHVHTDQGIQVQRPASGLVTAVEPVMRACSGTWIAQGSGSADKESADAKGRLRVPPDRPSYTLRRIWLSEEEERGYYYGFANEGIWPLCHIAHVRPNFRGADWEQYVKVNQRFADAVVEETNTHDPVILVQDYHFALLPRMIRELLPRATILTFWHIPWPNPESFGICPWRNEILEGLLGSTILGFHTPYHRKNFIETVDRFLETRIEHENSTISYRGKLTMVQDYPISIHWPGATADGADMVAEPRQRIRQQLGLDDEDKLLLGVDRLDYTKGIIERFEAVERLLEKRPEWVGRLCLLQIAAPSRSLLDEYQGFESRVRATAARINERFGDARIPPILLRIEQHSHGAVVEHYRACDICMVTSLHDGMNLVAKEFVAAREDEAGVLILSQFAGAAGELREALVINPYDREETAAALHSALSMAPAEQRERMRSLRALVRDFNIYRWAGRMLVDAAVARRQARIQERIFYQSASPSRRKR